MKPNIPKELPFLPGNVFTDPFKTSFHKTQQFSYQTNSQQEKRQFVGEQIDPHLIDELTKSINSLTFMKQRQKAENDFIPRVQPPWLKYDRKVLRFWAYFQEHVVESRLENYRIRKVGIYYYLSDQTIFVTEHKIQNSGIPQGVFLKRQKIPKTIGQLGDNYNWMDFQLGMNINFYQRLFRIYDCDKFTREFYEYMDMPLGEPEQAPTDTFNHFMTVKDAKINPPDTKEYKEYIEVRLGGGHPNNGLHQYISNDRKVLSYKLLWQDKNYEGGYNYFTLNYFLADGTVEVKQLRFQNSGKDSFPLLLRKQKLAKKPIHTYYPGMSQIKEQYYKPEDFVIGETVNVFGRECLVYGCDDFTKIWYRNNLGIQLQPISVQEGQKKAVKHAVPPYNGYGSVQDSLGNVYALQPKPPKKDMAKLFTNDQFVLRFQARLISEVKDENNRSFIVSFFCGDDTIQIYQNADKNSGIWGGKFLERKRHEHPTEQRYIVDSDFQIGGLVKINVYTFQLLKADDFTIQYMRERPQKFPEIDLSQAINSIRELARNHSKYDDFLIFVLKNVDPDNKGQLSYDEFFKNVGKIAKLTHPQSYIIFKQCKENNKLSMKSLFRLLGGS